MRVRRSWVRNPWKHSSIPGPRVRAGRPGNPVREPFPLHARDWRPRGLRSFSSVTRARLVRVGSYEVYTIRNENQSLGTPDSRTGATDFRSLEVTDGIASIACSCNAFSPGGKLSDAGLSATDRK